METAQTRPERPQDRTELSDRAAVGWIRGAVNDSSLSGLSAPARSNLQTLSLSRLTKRQTREMIAALSAARALPESVVEQLIARADGIPLFAEELTQAVVEAGSGAAVAEIPVTLQDSLLARTRPRSRIAPRSDPRAG